MSKLLTSDRFQLLVNTQSSKPIPDFQLVNIFGTLHGNLDNRNAKTIIISANYDSSGIATVSSIFLLSI